MNVDIVEVIRMIERTLRDKAVIWAIGGSVGFVLRGIAVDPPGDLDIQSNREGAYEIERLLNSYSCHAVRFLTSQSLRSHLGELTIDNVRVEIMGDVQHRIGEDWSPKPDMKSVTEMIDFEGRKLPVVSLSQELYAYGLMGRTQVVTLIESWLARGE